MLDHDQDRQRCRHRFPGDTNVEVQSPTSSPTMIIEVSGNGGIINRRRHAVLRWCSECGMGMQHDPLGQVLLCHVAELSFEVFWGKLGSWEVGDLAGNETLF